MALINMPGSADINDGVKEFEGTEGAVLLDVRTADEYAEGHIPGSINIPLNTYLLLLKSELYADMPAQEFLDRVCEWSLVFFLDSGNRWYNARIIVNDWVVRINNSDL